MPDRDFTGLFIHWQQDVPVQQYHKIAGINATARQDKATKSASRLIGASAYESL